VSASQLLIAETYGNRYVVDRYIGEGGMQEVYAATDVTLERQVALKVPKNNAAERRFQRSAVLSAKVNHPNVAKTLDYFEQGGRYYLVEELIDGIDLSVLRARAPRLDPYTTARILHHLAKGVAASHHVDVVHRDLKPSNIMVDSRFQLEVIKVTDFGIAKMAEQEMAEAAVSDATITSSHTMMGALPYLSPEMVHKPKDAGCPADIWALGAIAFELLSGVKPFGGGLAAVPTILAAEMPDLPPHVVQKAQFRPLANEIYHVIGQCLKKDPASRPTADDLVAACENLCYQTALRWTGRVHNYAASTFGFIQPDGGGNPVFFHVDSVYGSRPAVGDRVWYARFNGAPRERAHPVVPLASQVG
jgi:serine/threonine-protein kinase